MKVEPVTVLNRPTGRLGTATELEQQEREMGTPMAQRPNQACA